MNKMLQKL